MEKLQSALAKAREKREGETAASAAPAPQTAPVAPRPSNVDERWNALATFEPDEEHLRTNRILTLQSGPEARPFDILRTKILLQMREHGWKRLAITSPTAACGKSTAACNLAIALGRQPDVRTMLFDFDLHRPAIAKYLGLPADRSVRNLLADGIPFDQVGVRFSNNLAVAAVRHVTSDPTRLLLSAKTSAMLDQIQAEYEPDIMLFDLPPFLVSDDTRAFLKNVDAVLLMASAGETTVTQIDTCEREVSELTNVLGVVLNQYRLAEESTKYEYY